MEVAAMEAVAQSQGKKYTDIQQTTEFSKLKCVNSFIIYGQVYNVIGIRFLFLQSIVKYWKNYADEKRFGNWQADL